MKVIEWLLMVRSQMKQEVVTMLDKYIRKIEPIIEELKGKRIEKVNGVNWVLSSRQSKVENN